MKIFKILAITLALLSLVGCVQVGGKPLPDEHFISTPGDMEHNDSENEDSHQLESSAVSGVESKLPEPEEVDPKTHPYMYDFLYGCLGWHTDVRHESWGTSMYIMRHKYLPYVLYVDSYVIQGEPLMPPRGQKIERHELNTTELELLDDAVLKSESKYITEEDGWQFIVYNPAMYNIGLRLWDASDYTSGNTPPFLLSSDGWPSDYLRREPYASRLLEERGVDIRDPWWDTFRYKGMYLLRPTATDYGTYYLVCTNVNEFEFHAEGVDASGELVSWEEAVERMDYMSYILPGIHVGGEYTYEFEY